MAAAIVVVRQDARNNASPLDLRVTCFGANPIADYGFGHPRWGRNGVVTDVGNIPRSHKSNDQQ